MFCSCCFRAGCWRDSAVIWPRDTACWEKRVPRTPEPGRTSSTSPKSRDFIGTRRSSSFRNGFVLLRQSCEAELLCPMRYRILGSTGLRVSVIGIGTWQFGGEWGRQYSQTDVDAILDQAAESGINLIDT